jgi:galactokinase
MTGAVGAEGRASAGPAGRRLGLAGDAIAVRAHAPGRVNLIGEHTDYTGGLVLPMAVDLGTTVSLVRGGATVALGSDQEPEPVAVGLGVPQDPAVLASVRPPWGRFVAGVVAALRPTAGGRGSVASTVPVGAGMSSSTSLMVATALALGFVGTATELALLLQRAEQAASGVPCGVMDQLTSAAGVAGHALLIDCDTLEVAPVRLPEGVEIAVVHSGQSRRLVDSAYAERRAQCEAAAAVVGPLRGVTLQDLAAIADDTERARARHVVTENSRVLDFAAALGAGEVREAGRLMVASHASLRDDFAVSTPALDGLVQALTARPGVHGARLMGAGFGGCVVALTEPGAITPSAADGVWIVHAVDGASVGPAEA